MTQVTVALDSDTVDHIVTQQLKQALDGLMQDAGRVGTDRAFAIFAHDPAEDLAEIQRHCAALQLILAYYGHSSS
jgi:hypothetical protein